MRYSEIDLQCEDITWFELMQIITLLHLPPAALETSLSLFVEARKKPMRFTIISTAHLPRLQRGTLLSQAATL